MGFHPSDYLRRGRRHALFWLTAPSLMSFVTGRLLAAVIHVLNDCLTQVAVASLSVAIAIYLSDDSQT